MNRRDAAIAMLALGAAAGPLGALAQAARPGKLPAIGFLDFGPAPTPEQAAERAKNPGPVVRRLRELGWIEGDTVRYEFAYAGGSQDRLPQAAIELLQKRVDLILAPGPEVAVAAARATKAIPIVFFGISIPAELGLIASLSRPGGNVTGVASGGSTWAVKLYELLKTIVPGTTRVASLVRPGIFQSVSGKSLNPWDPVFDAAAGKLGLELRRFPVNEAEDFDAAFAAILKSRAQALAISTTRLMALNRQRLADFANRNRLPSAFDSPLFVEAGGLFSYGAVASETARRSAEYLDRILRGARPADLPVEFPTRYELVVNQKTARSLGLTIPQEVMLRADRVIE